MNNLKSKLSQLKKYIGKTDKESRIKFESMLSEIKAMKLTDEEKSIFKEFLMSGMEDVKQNVDAIENGLKIRDQLKEVSEVLPLSYIAKNYFGKSAAWLYQRINGNKVRGRIYSLNDKEIEIFNHALKEIGTKISSLSITC